MGSLAVTALTVILGFLFVFFGALKLTPKIIPDVHGEMKSDFVRFAKVFPMQSLTGFKPSPAAYRKAVGATEVVCGLLLMLVPGVLKQLANVIAVGIMIGAVYTHYVLGDGIEKCAMPLVLGLLLAGRLFIGRQTGNAQQIKTKKRQ